MNKGKRQNMTAMVLMLVMAFGFMAFAMFSGFAAASDGTSLTSLSTNVVAMVGGSTIALVLGVLAILYAKGYLPFGKVNAKTGNILTMAGAILIVLALVAMGVFGTAGTTTTTTVTPATVATFGLTLTSTDAELSIDPVTLGVTWAVSFNDTSDAFVDSTGVAQLNITFLRTDTNADDAIATATVGAIPTITSTTGNTYDYVTKTTAGQYNAKLINPAGATSYMSGTVLVAGGSSNYLNLNITLNSNAIAEMDTYGTTHITVTAGGHSIDITILKATVTT